MTDEAIKTTYFN